MKKVHLFLSLMVVILTYPLISLLIVLIIGNLVQNPTLWSHPITLLSLVIFILLFRKSIQFRQSFNIKISIKTIIIHVYSYRIYRFHFQRYIINKKRIFHVSKIDIRFSFNSCFGGDKLQNYYYQ